ncbi:MAG: hypothetical protein ABSA13_05890 [Beijerinckiaceae bacterium]|jgi:hypothetical protein
MKATILTAFAVLLVMGSLMASIEEAGAVVCARGVYRAGCVGVHGAVVVHHPVVYRRPVVVRRRVY